jgi:hypothetical protein
MSNLCHCANVSQLLKWRRGILLGNNKYYPKDLIPAVAKLGMQDDEILDYYYKLRRSEAWKKVGTSFVMGNRKSTKGSEGLFKNLWIFLKSLVKIN